MPGPGRSIAAAVGSVIHQLLEHFDPAAEPAALRARQLDQLGELLEPLVEPGGLDAARTRGRELLERLHDGPLLDRLRALGTDVARELPLLAAPGPGPASPTGCWAGVIDLLYQDPESGDWVVADYKTDRARSDAEIRELLARYAPQGAVYTAAVQEALRLPRTPRFELWLLDAGRVEPVAPVQSPAP
jgi:ATP-dependent exoDNAse (exonuclease V) beta subunit